MRRPAGTLLVVAFTSRSSSRRSSRSYLCSAVAPTNDSATEPMSRGLPLASAALTRWRRLEPSTSRPPRPRFLLVLIVPRLIAKDQIRAAVLLCLMFETCVRSSEPLAPHQFQLIPPLPFLRHRSLLVRVFPCERARPTQVFHSTFLATSTLPFHRQLGPRRPGDRKKAQSDPPVTHVSVDQRGRMRSTSSVVNRFAS